MPPHRPVTPTLALVPCTGSGLALGFQSSLLPGLPSGHGHGAGSREARRERASTAPCLSQLHPAAVMAAPAPSWCLSLLMLLLTLTTALEPPAVKGRSQLTCFYNSRANVSCAWSPQEGLPATACRIHARSDVRPWNVTCQMLPVNGASSACNLILGDPDSQRLTAADRVNISLVCWEGQQWRMVVTQTFRPFDNLRLKTPHALQVGSVDSRTCNVTWRVSQISHYIQQDLEFEVRKRSLAHSWEEASVLSLKQRQQWISLETLIPDTAYELQVRVRPQRGDHTVWSPWSQTLAFRTKPERAAPAPWTSAVLTVGGLLGLFISVYFLANCLHLGPWLKTALRSHTPDPSKFFSRHEDVQKWLSSPFPAPSFSPAGLAPEISPLEVLDRDAKAKQLLLLPQDKASSPSPSGHSQTSCFTNQGYFFFQLPDALEIEACQVYFTYDPWVEGEPEELPPPGPPFLPLPPAFGDEHAYCTFPPGDDLLLFSPSGPSPPHTALGGRGTSKGRLSSTQQEGHPQDGDPQPLGPPTPATPELQAWQSLVELAAGEAGGEVSASGDGDSFPWTSANDQHQGRAPAAGLALNTDAYLSLQELQAQDPTHLV
ncbi:interleukin-2 receptor subunit beta isoform X1 [Dipodomys spectabilis]|uniref:interleukin-2 receptor subunit beta isoform X1 n=2 Tax=Dipodomys spectabilis TaxID=105255 RepID=UPI001C536A42|nr:interleukin-2 receptor subunit beta isoform X1 [Dipodomys spectabilis]